MPSECLSHVSRDELARNPYPKSSNAQRFNSV
jgi:hypothetical protein